MMQANSIPIRRVLEKLDRYFEKKDFDAAEQLLISWLAEAVEVGDQSARLALLNEQVGFYRKTENQTACFEAIEKALSLSCYMSQSPTVLLATTFLNCATGYKAFGEPEKALSLYQKAEPLYEALLKPEDKRRAGLYNNMALAYMDLGYYSEAEDYFIKAIRQLRTLPHGEAEMAISYCNLADLAVAEFGLVEAKDLVREHLFAARELLNTADLPRDGYYAYVCEKCAPTFGFYGDPMTERELLARADACVRKRK